MRYERKRKKEAKKIWQLCLSGSLFLVLMWEKEMVFLFSLKCKRQQSQKIDQLSLWLEAHRSRRVYALCRMFSSTDPSLGMETRACSEEERRPGLGLVPGYAGQMDTRLVQEDALFIHSLFHSLIHSRSLYWMPFPYYWHLVVLRIKRWAHIAHKWMDGTDEGAGPVIEYHVQEPWEHMQESLFFILDGQGKLFRAVSDTLK